MESNFATTSLLACASFIGAAAIKYAMREPTPSSLCEHCGRDPAAPYHSGFNGYFIDENLACRGLMEITPQEKK